MLDVLYYSIPHYTVLEYVDYESIRDKINITHSFKMREDTDIEDISNFIYLKITMSNFADNQNTNKKYLWYQCRSLWYYKNVETEQRIFRRCPEMRSKQILPA